MTNYYQPEIETMPVDKIQALQSERLAEQVKFVYDNVKFYHDKMDEAGVKPEDVKGIEDLHKLPFIKTTCGISTRMDCLGCRCQSVCASSRRAARQGAVWWHFTRRRISMCGKSAVRVQLWRRAVLRTMCAMCVMDTGSSREVRDLMAARTR